MVIEYEKSNTWTMDCTGQSPWRSSAEPSTHSMADRPDRALAGKLLDLEPAERGRELAVQRKSKIERKKRKADIESDQ